MGTGSSDEVHTTLDGESGNTRDRLVLTVATDDAVNSGDLAEAETIPAPCVALAETDKARNCAQTLSALAPPLFRLTRINE